MELDKLEADLRTLADLAYLRHAALQQADPSPRDRADELNSALVLAETLQNIAVRLSTAMKEIAARTPPQADPGS